MISLIKDYLPSVIPYKVDQGPDECVSVIIVGLVMAGKIKLKLIDYNTH